MQNATRCPIPRCGRTFSESTGEQVDPEVARVVSATVCPECRAAANQASLAAWRKLTPMEREGARTREERGC